MRASSAHLDGRVFTIDTECGTAGEQITCTFASKLAASGIVWKDVGARTRHDASILAVTWNDAIRVAADAVHASMIAITTTPEPARIVHFVAMVRSLRLSSGGWPSMTHSEGVDRRMHARMLRSRMPIDDEIA